MPDKRLYYDKNGKYIGYSEPQSFVSGASINWDNIPPKDAEEGLMMGLWCLIIDFVCLIVSFGVFHSGKMLAIGACIISTVYLAIVIVRTIVYLVMPSKHGKKWYSDAIISLLAMSVYLVVHILIMVYAN